MNNPNLGMTPSSREPSPTGQIPQLPEEPLGEIVPPKGELPQKVEPEVAPESEQSMVIEKPPTEVSQDKKALATQEIPPGAKKRKYRRKRFGWSHY